MRSRNSVTLGTRLVGEIDYRTKHDVTQNTGREEHDLSFSKTGTNGVWTKPRFFYFSCIFQIKTEYTYFDTDMKKSTDI